MFTTDMGSLAHDRIHDLFTALDSMREILSAEHAKDHPSPVRVTHPALEEAIYETSEKIEDEIIAWLQAVVYQERGTHDVEHIDHLFGGRIERLGLIDIAYANVYPNRERPQAA